MTSGFIHLASKIKMKILHVLIPSFSSKNPDMAVYHNIEARY